MKTTINIDHADDVVISYDEESGERVTRTFTCSREGGYVYECLASGDRRQVCDKLRSRGSTLSAGGRGAQLAQVIRREYRAMRAAEKRETARYAY